MSSKLITDAFPKVKKERFVKKTPEKSRKQRQDIQDVKVSVQDKLAKRLNILREFDLSADYGPCIGISRIERWERADKFGLHPPQNVKDIIADHLDDEQYTKCIWYQEKL